MSFTNDDILTLARAGFTATQISALNSIQTPVQPIQPVVQPVTDQYGDTLNQILSAIQTNAINQTAQPKVQTTDEILAEIINPPIREEK